MDIRIICSALFLLFAASPALSGDIKRWVDQDGRVHFGDTAPHGTTATTSNPVITTTTPGVNNSLQDILRPGERRMLRNYEKRGLRLSKEKQRSLKQAQRGEKQLARMEDKCHYHKQKQDELKRKLRSGYKPSRKASITQSINRHRAQIRRYCSYR